MTAALTSMAWGRLSCGQDGRTNELVYQDDRNDIDELIALFSYQFHLILGLAM